MQRNLIYIVFLTIFLTFGTGSSFAQELKKKGKSFPAKNQTNTTPKDTTSTNILPVATDTIKLDSIKKKPLLESKVKYKAKKYAKMDHKKKLITLYDGAELYYQDIELKSGIIVFDYQKNEWAGEANVFVHASAKPKSGVVLPRLIFVLVKMKLRFGSK